MKQNQPSPFIQIVGNFVIPIIILNRFSGEDSIGPVGAMLLALAFPVLLELRNVFRQKHFSWVSGVAIGGILVTGLISILGLGEGWLAARRSIPYAAMALGLLIALRLRKAPLDWLLSQVLDVRLANEAAKERGMAAKLQRIKRRTQLYMVLLLAGIAIVSYVLTQIVITTDVGSAEFNKEYANLRVLTIPFVTVPLFVGFGGCLVYVCYKIEKLTGLDLDTLTKNSKPKK